jgi:hypothetical protein
VEALKVPKQMAHEPPPGTFNDADDDDDNDVDEENVKGDEDFPLRLFPVLFSVPSTRLFSSGMHNF